MESQDFMDQLNAELTGQVSEDDMEPLERLDSALAAIADLKASISVLVAELKAEEEKARVIAAEQAVKDRSHGGYRVVQKRMIVCASAVELEKIDPKLVKYDTNPKVDQKALTARWDAGDREIFENVVHETVEFVLQAETRKAYVDA